MNDMYLFRRDGQHMLVYLRDENDRVRRGALIATDYAVARDFARDLNAESEARVSVYRLGAAAPLATELGRLATVRAHGENCAWFLDSYDPEHQGTVFDGLPLRMVDLPAGDVRQEGGDV
jgi:hypothetical protein